LSHPNIVKYYESFLFKSRLCIVMDYAENGRFNIFKFGIGDLSKKIKEAKANQERFSSE